MGRFGSKRSRSRGSIGLGYQIRFICYMVRAIWSYWCFNDKDLHYAGANPDLGR